MRQEAIQQLMTEVASLPEADQRLVADFVSAIKRQPEQTASAESPSIVEREGMLIYTGQLLAPDIDWVRFFREQRIEELAHFTRVAPE